MTILTMEDVVRDRASDALYTLQAESTVDDAVELMARVEIGAVLVMSEDQLVSGIFTERDLLLRVVRPGLNGATTPLSMVMTRDVRFVSPSTPIEAALALMHVQRHRHLLVIDGPHVRGLVSMRDMVYQMLRNGQGRFEAAVRAATPPAMPTASA